MVAWNTLGLQTNCHCFKPLRCRYKASLVGGTLSTSWVFCEYTFSRMRSTSLSSLESLQYRIGLQTSCAAIVFNLAWRCLKWSVNSNCIFFQERWYFVH